MSTRELAGKQKALGLLIGAVALVLIIAAGLLLREHGPGNMGNGFLQGAAVGLVGAGIMFWRVNRRTASTFERAWTQTGDERDDRVLTHALAVLGLLAFPLTGAAAIAIGLGLHAPMVLFLLLCAELVVGAVSFVVINRRS
jgi:drug/metabolite transporter (DMT)-like permease